MWAQPPLWLRRLGAHAQPLAYITVGVVSLYSVLTFGPTISAVHAWQGVTRADTVKARAAALDAQYNLDASVLAGYSTLVENAERPQVYAGHYAFLGKRQFSEKAYPLPNNLDRVVLDAQDFVTYQLQYSDSDTRATAYATGAERFHKLLTEHDLRLTRTVDTLLFFERTGQDLLPALVTRTPSQPLSGVEFGFGAELQITNQDEATLVLRGQINSPLLNNLQARLRWYDEKDHLLETRLLPLGYGLYPSTSWGADEVVITRFTLILPPGAARAEVEAIVPHGHLQLNGWRAAEPVLDDNTRVVSPVRTLLVE